MYPLVSVCVPVYNVERFLERCLNSLFTQTYTNLEYIFVDDCSPDNSAQLIRQVANRYKYSDRIRIISHEKNRGLAAARNTAVSAALGDFIVHIDSDDWLEPSYVDALVKKQMETDADIVSCNAIAHYPSRIEFLKEPCYVTPYEMVRKMIRLNPDHVIWRRLIRRSLYTDNQIKAIEGINIGEDHHTLPKLAYYARKVEKIPDFSYHYNCENDNSYMRLTKDGFNFIKYSSDRNSTFILLDFFSSISQELCDELYGDLIRYEYQSLKKVGLMRSVHNYRVIVMDINKIPQKYWGLIGWDRKAYKLLESFCVGMSIKLFIQRIKRGHRFA